MTIQCLKQIPSNKRGATDMSLMLPALNRNFIGRSALSTVTLIFVVLPPLLFPMCCVSPFLRPSLVGGESRLNSSWTAFFVSSAKVSVNTVTITKLRGQSVPRASGFQHPFNTAESTAQIKTRSSLFLTTIRVCPIRHRLIHSSFYFPKKIFYHTLSTARSKKCILNPSARCDNIPSIKGRG